MHNFTYHNPVKIVFGQGQIAELEHLIPTDKKVLITYGGGSIFKNGVMDQVKSALKNHQIVEFGGIEANPDYETSLRAVEVVKKENIGFILGVGGGSVADASKFIGFLAANDDVTDPWNEIVLLQKKSFKDSIPIGTVMTLPATGSEMNGTSVVSWRAKGLKRSFRHPSTFPKFSIIDPQTTYSLPAKQVTNGIVDTFVHVVEQYVIENVNAPIQDGFSAMLLKVTMENGLQVLNKPNDYDIRANLCWAATQALNGFISAGRAPSVDWSTHMIGHEFTAVYELDHGQSLAPTILADWQIRRDLKKDQLLHMAQHVFHITNGSDDDKIDGVIKQTTAFFKEIGMQTKFSEHAHIPANCHEVILKQFADTDRDQIGYGSHPIDMATVEKIIKQAY